ncbi:MAG TPA: DUF3164 family protein [Candidatus Defluviicoccus seviourii]|nr:DUF3164 family protein [Candidatus Defluviicoccus seviourii]
MTDPTIDINGKSYMTDAKGALVPVETIKAQHLLEDEVVRKVMGFARELSEQIARFKGHTFEDLNAFQTLLEQEYEARKGGAKGNVTFQSFDGCMKVQVQIADQISFGAELQVAKKLIDECLVEWGAESRSELRALVNRVFAVEKEGQINRGELFSLLRLDIADERWKRAMDAIHDSIRVTGTKAYVRFYERPDPTAAWQSVTIDLAAA